MTISKEHYENLLKYIKNLEEIKNEQHKPYRDAFQDYLAFEHNSPFKKGKEFEKASEIALNQVLLHYSLVKVIDAGGHLYLMNLDAYMLRLWELDDIVRIE